MPGVWHKLPTGELIKEREGKDKNIFKLLKNKIIIGELKCLKRSPIAKSADKMGANNSIVIKFLR